MTTPPHTHKKKSNHQNPDSHCCRGLAGVKTQILFSPSWNANESLAMWCSTLAEAVYAMDGLGKRLPPSYPEQPMVGSSCCSTVHRAGNISPDLLHWETTDGRHEVRSSKEMSHSCGIEMHLFHNKALLFPPKDLTHFLEQLEILKLVIPRLSIKHILLISTLRAYFPDTTYFVYCVTLPAC